MAKKELFCPVETTLSVISGKWKLRIIYHLIKKPRRFNQLQRDLGKITHHSLSRQLKEMEKDGLVVRTEHAEKSLHVEYSLSPLGHSLNAIIQPMHRWGELYEKNHKKPQKKKKK